MQRLGRIVAFLLTGCTAVAIAAPTATRWIPATDVPGLDGRLLEAEAHARAGACDVASTIVDAMRATCGAPPCDLDGRRIDDIERRCAVDRSGLAAPTDGRLEIDGPARPGLVVVGARRLTYVAADGRRFTRALCVASGAPPSVSFDPDDPRTVSIEGDTRTRARAHLAAAQTHIAAERWCEAAMAFEAVRAQIPRPGLMWNIALAHSKRPDGCAAALAALDASHGVEIGPAARARMPSTREALEARCIARLIVTGVPPGSTLDINGAPMPANGQLAAGVHRLEVSGAGHPAQVTWLALSPGERRQVTYTPPTIRPADDPDGLGWLWAPIAAVGLGLAAGGAFTALALDDLDAHDAAVEAARRDPTRSYLSAQRAALSDFDRDRTLAGIGWGLAAAGAVAFALGWGLDSAIAPTPGGASLGVEGRF